jgi:uncharacterized membrane protein
VLVPYDLETQ